MFNITVYFNIYSVYATLCSVALVSIVGMEKKDLSFNRSFPDFWGDSYHHWVLGYTAQTKPLGGRFQGGAFGNNKL